MHELGSDLPCECLHLSVFDFAAPFRLMLHDSANFTERQLEHLDAIGRGYRVHRSIQALQHRENPRRSA